jgi:hypothetical protein
METRKMIMIQNNMIWTSKVISKTLIMMKMTRANKMGKLRLKINEFF